MTSTLNNLIIYFFTLFILWGCESNSDKNLIWVDSSCNNLSEIDYDIEQINEKLAERYKDSLWNTYWKSELDAQVEELNKYPENQHALFPYHAVDSAVFFFYKPISKIDGPIPLEEREIEDVSVLCLEKVELLLKVINNPLNFGVGECGTNIPFSKVVLYHKGKEVGDLVFSCGYSMVKTSPYSPMVTGGFTESGDSLLNTIKIWE